MIDRREKISGNEWTDKSKLVEVCGMFVCQEIRLVNVPTVQTITATNISNRMSIVFEEYKATYNENH